MSCCANNKREILRYHEKDNNIQEVEQKAYLKCTPKIGKNLVFHFQCVFKITH